MKSFEYAAPTELKEAFALLGTTWGQTEVLAGGTDLVTTLKQRLSRPERVVSLKNIEELRGIEVEKGGVRFRAMTTLADLAGHGAMKQHFPSLITAINGIGSAQILHAGTVGGDLCQRPRCWYFRNGFGLLGRQGETSLIRDGDNRYHAIFGDNGPALFVSPSSLGPALISLGAVIAAASARATRTIPAAEFFRIPTNEGERETALKPGEIVKDVFVPLQDLKNATYEIRHRHGLDWPYATASVAFKMTAGKASDVRIVLGHVAPVPWVAPRAAQVLEGARLDETVAGQCAEAALAGARPLSGNAYKIPMTKTAVKRAVLAAAAA